MPTAEVEVAMKDRSLDGLATTANREYQLAEQAAGETVKRGIRVGEALIEAKARVEGGVVREPDGSLRASWTQWIEQNCTFTPAEARTFIRWAKYAHVLVTTGAATQKEARAALRGLPAAASMGVEYPEEIRAHAKRLHKEGWGWKKIAAELGVNRRTVQAWVDPRYRRNREQRKERNRVKRRQEEKEATIKRAVKKAGAATQELYAMAERMQDVLAQAHDEATDPEARRALDEAGRRYRQMRDEIVRALGVS